MSVCIIKERNGPARADQGLLNFTTTSPYPTLSASLKPGKKLSSKWIVPSKTDSAKKVFCEYKQMLISNKIEIPNYCP